jgi:hypothetical protein
VGVGPLLADAEGASLRNGRYCETVIASTRFWTLCLADLSVSARLCGGVRAVSLITE